MTDEELARALQSVGMSFFVRHISSLTDLRIGSASLAERLRGKEPYTDKSLSSRVSHARRIVQAGRVDDAMRKISAAKVEDHVAALARRWGGLT